MGGTRINIWKLSRRGWNPKQCSSVFASVAICFGGSSALTAAVFSMSGVVGGFIAPVLGRILDKIGPRYLFPIAGVIILLGFLASSMVSNIWQLFIFYSVLATLGHTTIGAFSATAVLAPWFP